MGKAGSSILNAALLFSYIDFIYFSFKHHRTGWDCCFLISLLYSAFSPLNYSKKYGLILNSERGYKKPYLAHTSSWVRCGSFASRLGRGFHWSTFRTTCWFEAYRSPGSPVQTNHQKDTLTKGI